MIESALRQEPVAPDGIFPGGSGRTNGSLISRTRNPYWMAPMSGITEAAFRQLMDEMGAGALVSDLVSAKGLIHGSGKTLGMVRVHANPGAPVGIQLFGESAEDIVEAAHTIKDAGAEFIDINLGCPVNKVVKKGCGAALLRDPAKLETYLAKIKNGIDLPLTVKMRTGWNEKELTIHECVAAAYNAGCEWVAIHGRTRAQGYSGRADWDLIAKVKERARIPIVGNGDIRSAERARARLRETGVDAVMIGRGALRNPWIFMQCLETNVPPGMPPGAMPPRANVNVGSDGFDSGGEREPSRTVEAWPVTSGRLPGAEAELSVATRRRSATIGTPAASAQAQGGVESSGTPAARWPGNAPGRMGPAPIALDKHCSPSESSPLGPAARWPGAMEILNRYRDLLREHYDSRRTLLMTRKLAVWMAYGYPGAAAFRGQAFQLHAIADLFDCAARFFDHTARFPPPRFDESESFMMGGHG
ncbi:MAG: tRNA-dihydrouridine synthase family protein [Nitrospinae bacterium]|nr:tRNA-dihydrouridine synthase family protein [Nitrospinota bacterium]